MSRAWAVVRREFMAMVGTRAFLVGTALGPIVMVGLIALQIFMSGGGPGDRTLVIVDATTDALGERVAAALAILPGAIDGSRTRFTVELEADPGIAGTVPLQRALRERIEARTLDGVLWLPPATVLGEVVLYEGRNATNLGEMERVRVAVQTAAQEVRLAEAGIDVAKVASAMRPVSLDTRKTGGRVASGPPMALFILTYVIGLAVYMVVMLYGNAVLRGVLEEKHDRIVEVVVSSIRADQLIIGKVVGIGAAGMFQMLIWLGFAAIALSRGDRIVARLGAELPALPYVPLSVGIVFLVFFLGGFLLYASIFAAMGAIATSDQEAQQLQFPVILLLVVSISMMMPVLNDPGGSIAVLGSLIPFTAPIVMPMRAALTEIPLLQLSGSVGSVLGGGLLFLWMAAKIYRIGTLSTGKRPSMAEIWRWIRTA